MLKLGEQAACLYRPLSASHLVSTLLSAAALIRPRRDLQRELILTLIRALILTLIRALILTLRPVARASAPKLPSPHVPA